MKKLENFLTMKPGYLKCGVSRIAKMCNVSENTVTRFKKTARFKELTRNYIN